jgi:spore coat polysaccharide biosynthesis protein SpsF
MKTTAIIQARMGSSRLPGKVLADLAGTPMLFRVIERVSAARLIDDVVVATTAENEDDVLVDRLRSEAHCKIFRGAVDDVLSRFYLCAKLHHADIVVRVTADDPLKDPEIIDRAVSLLSDNSNLDYCSNTIEPSYPEGLDIEAIRFSALERAHTEARLLSEREHVTPYIWKHPEMFKMRNFKSERNLSGWRWTVDRPEDLEFMRRVFEQFRSDPLVSYQEVVKWLDANPHVAMINSGIKRNEGYLKSLHAEQS